MAGAGAGADQIPPAAAQAGVSAPGDSEILARMGDADETREQIAELRSDLQFIFDISVIWFKKFDF